MNADQTAIQFQLLNAFKDPPVQSPRAQCDKEACQFRMRYVQERTEYGIEINAPLASMAKTVIVTIGTFLGRLMHTGKDTMRGGLFGDSALHARSNLRSNCGIKLGHGDGNTA
jgi:tRNA uridine 5-carboxymethylaminomethyl modification enzyme